MRIQMRGPEGAMQRIRELQDQITNLTGDVLTGSTPPPSPEPIISSSPGRGSFASRLDGLIGGNLRPLDPMGAGMQRTPIDRQSQILSMVRAAALKNGVDPAIFESLVKQESDFDPRCQSSAGAMGLAQLMPGTAKALGVTDPFDPAQNLDGGARYFAQMLKQFGDVKLALAAYNAGPGPVTRAGPGVPDIPETRAYVEKVMKNAALLRGGGLR